jgi:hypothetical protein
MDVCGISGDKYATGPKLFDPAAIDVEIRGPHQIRKPCGMLQAAVRKSLALRERGLRIMRDLSVKVGHQSVAALAKREDADQSFFRGEDIQLVLRQIPVDMEIGQEEALLVGLPFKAELEVFTNKAVSAIAADEVQGVSMLDVSVAVPECDVYSVACVLEINKFDAPFDPDAEALHLPGHDAFGYRLIEKEEVWISAGKRTEIETQQVLSGGVEISSAAFLTEMQKWLNEAPLLE